MTTVKMLKGDDEYAIQFDVTSRRRDLKHSRATVAASHTSCQHVVMMLLGRTKVLTWIRFLCKSDDVFAVDVVVLRRERPRECSS